MAEKNVPFLLAPVRASTKAVFGSRLGQNNLKQVQNFERIRQRCFERGELFIDPEFPTDNASLGDKEMERIEWKRPWEITENPRFVVDGIDRFDIKQGNLGDCWFLSTLASVTMHPELMKRIIPDGQSFAKNEYAGVFYFRFWHYGEWVEVVIDDRLPVVRSRMLAFSYSEQENEYWTALLEKAYAKLYGSYGALAGGWPGEAMADLTGGLVENFFTKQQEQTAERLFEFLQKCNEVPTIIACGIYRNTMEAQDLGLFGGHAYSITRIDSVEANGKVQNLVRVRNPWGTENEWIGPWSDRSENWKTVPESKKTEMGYHSCGDGEFWMSISDFRRFFDIVQVCYYAPAKTDQRTWRTYCVDGKWEGSTAAGCRKGIYDNPMFKVEIEKIEAAKTGSVVISVHQKNTREERKRTLEVGFDIIKMEVPDQKKPSKKAFRNLKSLVGFSPTYFREKTEKLLLPSGSYIIIPYSTHKRQEGDFLVRVLAESWMKIRLVELKNYSGKDNVDSVNDIQSLFLDTAGFDEQINVPELYHILTDIQHPGMNRIFTSDDVHLVSIQLCEKLLMAYDSNYNGKLSWKEFTCLIEDLSEWRKVFDRYKSDSSSTITPDELSEALRSVGCHCRQEQISTMRGLSMDINYPLSLIYALDLPYVRETAL